MQSRAQGKGFWEGVVYNNCEQGGRQSKGEEMANGKWVLHHKDDPSLRTSSWCLMSLTAPS